MSRFEPPFTVSEFAEHMNIKPCTVRTYINNGKITAFKFGKSWRIPYREYENYEVKNSNIKGYVHTHGDKVMKRLMKQII